MSGSTRRVVLASASPARLALLRSSGIEPVVQVSDVDEDAVQARLGTSDPARICAALAEAKAREVAGRCELADAVVIGADSMLDLDGTAYGKPADAAEATRRWGLMAGRTGVLRTGHHVVDLRTGRSAGVVASTRVTFADPDAEELAAYVASGEPLRVAGAFTIDGLGAAFVTAIEGDPSTVVGLSLPGLRELLHTLGIRWTDLWAPPAMPPRG